MRKLIALLLAAMCGGAQAQLQARDINADGSIDAFYDSTQDLTWLADANHAATSGYWDSLGYAGYPLPIEPGRMTHSESVAWAAQLDFHGVTDWRLPLLLDPAGVMPGLGIPPDVPCSALSGWLCAVGPNEMTVLYSQLAGDTSQFLNVQAFEYWTGSLFGLNDGWAAYVNRTTWASGTTDELGVPAFAWAVRDGDVALAVPEPSTYAMLALGLAAVGFATRRRRATEQRGRGAV